MPAACRAPGTRRARPDRPAMSLSATAAAALAKFALLARVGGVGEEGEVACSRRVGRNVRQHLGDEAAARMRQQVQPCALRQRVDERSGVGDRARAQRRMIERVDAAAVALKQFRDASGVLAPKLLERALGVDEGSVEQHQDRAVDRWHLIDLSTAALELVEATASSA